MSAEPEKSALLKAAYKGDVQAVKGHLRSYTADVRGVRDCTCLHAAGASCLNFLAGSFPSLSRYQHHDPNPADMLSAFIPDIIVFSVTVPSVAFVFRSHVFRPVCDSLLPKPSAGRTLP